MATGPSNASYGVLSCHFWTSNLDHMRTPAILLDQDHMYAPRADVGLLDCEIRTERQHELLNLFGVCAVRVRWGSSKVGWDVNAPPSPLYS